MSNIIQPNSQPTAPENTPSTFTAPTQEWEQRMSEKKLDAGMLGKVFGTGHHAQTNSAGVAIVAAFVIGGFATVYKSDATNVEVWQYMTPIITGALGYLFGRNTRE